MSSHQRLPDTWARPFQRQDRDSIFELLHFLPNFYPNAESWLDRRLDDVERRRALCTVGGAGSSICGILIETPKGRRSTKISTLYVRPSLVRLGMATKLLNHHKLGWIDKSVDHIFITVAAERLRATAGFLSARGFVPAVRIQDRYRIDREETVFTMNVQ